VGHVFLLISTKHPVSMYTTNHQLQMESPKRHIYCGNNALHTSILRGESRFGTHDLCFKKGYAKGINQHIPDVAAFLQKWNGKYKPHIPQRLFYSDSALPPGYQRATLTQSLMRGFALGSISRAKKLAQNATLTSPRSRRSSSPRR